MKYAPPYDATTEDQSYVDGNPATGTEGSVVPAAAIENPQREIVNVIDYSDIIPASGDNTQLTQAVRSQWLNFAVDTGSVNQLSITLDPALGTYKQGLPLHVLAANSNTGATYLNVNGLGPRTIRRANGADLVAGDISAGGIITVVDDGTYFQLQNYLGGGPSTVNTYYTNVPYAEDSALPAAPNTLIASFSDLWHNPPQAGDLILVKVANTNNGAVQLQITAPWAGTVALKRNDGAALEAVDLTAGEVILLEYHTTYWQMMRLVRSQVYWRLSADLTLYVRTDATGGTDVGKDGSVNDANHAFYTVQGAINFVQQSMGIAGRNVTIQLGMAGTYTGGITVNYLNTGLITIMGDDAGRATYILGNNAGQAVISVNGSNLFVRGVTLYNNTSNWPTVMTGVCDLNLFNVRFSGVVADINQESYDLQVVSGRVRIQSVIEFMRSGKTAIMVQQGGRCVVTPGTLVYVDNKTFVAFVRATEASYLGIDSASVGMSGTATGYRFVASLNSVINTLGGGPNYFPGSIAGLVDSSSVYA